MEMPGCSLCMGNQARVEDNTTVFSTSTRNFNNRLGNGSQVYLGSAELAAVCAQLGRIPSKQEYLAIAAYVLRHGDAEEALRQSQLLAASEQAQHWSEQVPNWADWTA